MDGMKVVQDKGIPINHVTGLLKLKRVKVEQEWRRVVIKIKLTIMLNLRLMRTR
jgi:metal-sulfur cluster biosynthetic enzyme